MLLADFVKFYVGLFKLAPSLLELSEKECWKRCSVISETIFNISATREHVKLARSQSRHSAVKRKWDLKYRYMVSLFLKVPRLGLHEAQRLAQTTFFQRTRITVVQTAAEEAAKFAREWSASKQAKFHQEVLREINARSKEVPII